MTANWGGECTCDIGKRPQNISEICKRLDAYEAIADDRETEIVDRVIAAESELAALRAKLATKLWECPECMFTFDAGHTNQDGTYSCPECEVGKLRAKLAEAEQRAEAAERALIRHGYYKSCDISVCNCGDQWNHGGNAAKRLTEIRETVNEFMDTNGIILRDAVRTLGERAEAAEKDAGRYRWLRDPKRNQQGKEGKDMIFAASFPYAHNITQFYSPESLDAAIDAARGAK